MIKTTPLFKDRFAAGQKLAKILPTEIGPETLVLALPRGGVPVGYQIAQHFNIALDVVLVRKLGSPLNPEFGIGALAENNVEILSPEASEHIYLSAEELIALRRREEKELRRRKQVYRSGRSLPNLKNKTVILTDDGLATGVTAQAAILAVKKNFPQRIILAVPVCAKETVPIIAGLVDDFICLAEPKDFQGVGLWYEQFEQVSDQEVVTLLNKQKANLARRA